eukprot:scaffold2056_cov129-Isochrysis_galbana.AAC.9
MSAQLPFLASVPKYNCELSALGGMCAVRWLKSDRDRGHRGEHGSPACWLGTKEHRGRRRIRNSGARCRGEAASKPNYTPAGRWPLDMDGRWTP